MVLLQLSMLLQEMREHHRRMLAPDSVHSTNVQLLPSPGFPSCPRRKIRHVTCHFDITDVIFGSASGFLNTTKRTIRHDPRASAEPMKGARHCFVTSGVLDYLCDDTVSSPVTLSSAIRALAVKTKSTVISTILPSSVKCLSPSAPALLDPASQSDHCGRHRKVFVIAFSKHLSAAKLSATNNSFSGSHFLSSPPTPCGT